MGASAWRRRDDRRRDTFARIGVMFLVVVLTAALVAPAGARSAFEGAVALVPQTPRGVGNCIPFANNTSFGFSGFIYRDVPSFRLEPGTRFAFDLGGLNDRDVRRNISFAVGSRNPSPGNGGVRALGWTQVVSDTQLPLNPRGNTIVGDYELEYTSEASFDFPGGGLVVGFGRSLRASLQGLPRQHSKRRRSREGRVASRGRARGTKSRGTLLRSTAATFRSRWRRWRDPGDPRSRRDGRGVVRRMEHAARDAGPFDGRRHVSGRGLQDRRSDRRVLQHPAPSFGFR